MLPLHHGGETDPNANLVQRFIDSEGGSILGTFLHTFGALLFTAGVALYLYQAHLVRSARLTKSLPSLHLLPYAHGFNLGGIAMNGLGGIMRLYQSDHPRIDQLTASSWVQLLFVKHIFLILGVGLAVYLTYRTHILSLRDDAAEVFLGETGRMTGFAWTAFVTILIASAFGAVATTQLEPVTAAAEEGDGMTEAEHAAMARATTLHFDNATGVITGSPAMPGREQAEIDVPQAASQLRIELSWSNAQSQLRLEVLDPAKKVVAGTVKTSVARVEYELLQALEPGQWTAVIHSERAVNERYSVVGRVTVGAPAGLVVDETYTVSPDPTGNVRFVEINLNMKRGNTITYTWEVLESSDPLNFNVHLHVGANVEYPVRGSWNKYSGTYTHNSTEEGVSLMWDNPNATPHRVHYRIEGNFTVHSRAIR